MTEAIVNHDGLVRPEYGSSGMDIIAKLDQQRDALQLILDFPTDDDNPPIKVAAWLNQAVKRYPGDEDLLRLSRHMRTVGQDERGELIEGMRRENNACRGEAQRLDKVVGQIRALYTKIIEDYSQLLDIEMIRDKAMEILNDAAVQAYGDECQRRRWSLDQIFPQNIAQVNVPPDCAVEIPAIKRWQHDHNITDSRLADREYMRLMNDARSGVKQEFEASDSSAVTITTEVFDNPLVTVPQHIHDVVYQYFSRLDNIDKKERNLSDQLKQHREAADGCINALRKYSEATPEMLMEQCAYSLTKQRIQEVTETAHQAAKQQFMDILTRHLEVFGKALKTYTIAPDAAVSGLQKVAKKKRKQKGSSVPVKNKAQTQEGCKMMLQQGDELLVDGEQFPWLGDENYSRPVIAVEHGTKNVAVLDMRTLATKAIEHKIAGYETEEKRQGLLPIITTKLELIGQMVAGADTTLSKLKHLDDRDTKRYPLPISYWGSKSKSQARIYISLVDVTGMPDGEMKDELMTSGVDRVVLFIGACDKNHQSDLMEEFKRFSW